MLRFENGTFEQTYNEALHSLINEEYLIGGDPQISYETNSVFQFDYTADAIEVVDNEFVVSYNYDVFIDDYEAIVQKNIDYYTKYFLRNMQLQSVIMRLKNNRSSKQAILSLPKDITNHYPAEMYVSFRILNDMLHTIAHMRANNAYGEALVNMHIDCALANKVASALGIRHTTYTHIVDGYHVYHRDLTKVKKVLSQCRHSLMS